MLTRFIGGIAACVGTAGLLAAQQPAAPTTNRPSTAFTAAAPKAAPTRPEAAQANPPMAPATLPSTVPAAPKTPIPGEGTSANLLTTCPSYANCVDGGAPNCEPACGCIPCGPPGKFWVDAGYVFWTTKAMNTPPLITTAPQGTPRATAGALGQPGTNIVGGNTGYNDNFRSGFYLRAGMWFDECQTCGIQGNFFYLGSSRSQQQASCPPGTQNIVTRPFTNGNTGLQDTELVCFPDVLSGSVAVNAKTDVIGGGVSFVKNLCCGPCGRFDLLLGYQYFNLRDDLSIRENLTSGPGQTNVPTGTRFAIEDRFRTTNNFHGALIGFQGERRFGKAFVGYNSSISFGENRQTYDVSGFTTITPPGGSPTTFAGGLLAQPSNIGHYSQSRFAVMPQVGVKLGYQLTERLRAYVGYDFLYLSNVARAGDQIDLRVNPTQIPPRTNGVSGPAVPAFSPRTTDFNMHGIRVGVELRF